MPQINVTINGRNFRMACDDGEEERLVGLAGRFDKCIGELRNQFGEIGDQRLTVMAGIMVLDELAEAERRIKALESEVATATEARLVALDKLNRSEQGIVDKIEEAAQRIESLSEGLTKSLKAQASAS